MGNEYGSFEGSLSKTPNAVLSRRMISEQGHYIMRHLKVLDQDHYTILIYGIPCDSKRGVHRQHRQHSLLRFSRFYPKLINARKYKIIG